jgi:23S rRNA (pseudouridine1915-N3)-methyltransferase
VRIVIAAVGRAARSPEQALCDLYCERARMLGGPLGLTKLDLAIVETSRASHPEARMAEEAEKLRRTLPKGARIVALDEQGKSLSSEDFAAHLAKLRDGGLRDLAFLIGGPDGLSAELRESADERLAFGPQTWPHLLVRAMSAEQIYRALSILARHPYHRPRQA